MTAEKKAASKILIIIILTAIFIQGCGRNIRLHHSYYPPAPAEGKILKKAALVIPALEYKKLYTYNAWWAGWSAHVNIGESLQKLFMDTLNSIFDDVTLFRERPGTKRVYELVLFPEIIYFNYKGPFFWRGYLGTASIQIKLKVEDSTGKALLEQTYNGIDKHSSLGYTTFKHIEDQSEKVFEYVFELIASDLKKL